MSVEEIVALAAQKKGQSQLLPPSGALSGNGHQSGIDFQNQSGLFQVVQPPRPHPHPTNPSQHSTNATPVRLNNHSQQLQYPPPSPSPAAITTTTMTAANNPFLPQNQDQQATPGSASDALIENKVFSMLNQYFAQAATGAGPQSQSQVVMTSAAQQSLQDANN